MDKSSASDIRRRPHRAHAAPGSNRFGAAKVDFKGDKGLRQAAASTSVFLAAIAGHAAGAK